MNKDIIDKLKAEPIDQIYNLPCVDNKSEWHVVADYLVSNNLLDGIVGIKRNSSYKVTHRSNPPSLDSRRVEEKDVLSFFKDKLILDYQIPLKNINADRAGKIDFTCEYNDQLYIVEYKKSGSDETLLRCILEIETYYKKIGDKEKFLKDFNYELNKKYQTVNKAICIYKDSFAYDQLKAKHNNLITLLKMYEIIIFDADELKNNRCFAVIEY